MVNDNEAQYYEEVMDEKGDVHLVDNRDGLEYDYGEEDDEMGMMGDDVDEEEFLQMMEQEEAMGRGINGVQQNSTIINSS
jgi:hypothetical protein